MLKISSESIIYIMCPANHATGGPEALHQLGKAILEQNRNVYMYYVHYDHINNDSPIHPSYSKYKVPYVLNIENDNKHVLIFPETFCIYLWDKPYTSLQKIVWWLSVTNFFISLKNIESQYKKKPFYFIKKYFRNYPIPTVDKVRNSYAIHLAHSYFSLDFLRKNKFEILGQLSDYMNDAFLEGNDFTLFKENIIIYNPVKNGEFLNKIIDKTSEYQWVPIKNMTPFEVSDLMKKAKVYIDFGYHPGKERMPREACLMDCCLIIGKDGSARFKEDMPILDQYHFEKDEKYYPDIVEQIHTCINLYDLKIQDFKEYKKVLLNEKNVFEDVVKSIFAKG